MEYCTLLHYTFCTACPFLSISHPSPQWCLQPDPSNWTWSSYIICISIVPRIPRHRQGFHWGRCCTNTGSLLSFSTDSPHQWIFLFWNSEFFKSGFLQFSWKMCLRTCLQCKPDSCMHRVCGYNLRDHFRKSDSSIKLSSFPNYINLLLECVSWPFYGGVCLGDQSFSRWFKWSRIGPHKKPSLPKGFISTGEIFTVFQIHYKHFKWRNLPKIKLIFSLFTVYCNKSEKNIPFPSFPWSCKEYRPLTSSKVHLIISITKHSS